MGYYASSGVIRGVHVSNADFEDGDKFSNAGLDVFLYTDTNTWDMVVGETVVKMEEDEIRQVNILPSNQHADAELMSRIRAVGILSDEVIEENFGTWFIQGGS